MRREAQTKNRSGAAAEIARARGVEAEHASVEAEAWRRA
jgi:hypothetical protein